jgi:hypothetical protein
MGKMKFILIAVVTIITSSCNSAKKTFVTSGNSQDDAIRTAILDFATIRKLYKEDSVFSVGVNELVNNKDFIVIGVRKNNRKLLLTKDTKVGSTGKLPSRYFEKDGKLFFWWDDSYSLTEDALAVFNKYNLLQDDKNGAIKIPDFIIDDAQKAAHYYFCKNNMRSYKRMITNKGIGYYEPPSLKCSDKN